MPEATSQAAAGAAPVEGQAAVIAGVGLGTPAAGAAAGAAAAGQSGSQAAAATSAEGKAWYDGLIADADNLSTIKAKNWASPEDAIKSYRELETAFSSRGAASQAPADPKDYAFTVPKEMEANYSNEFADTFRQVAKKAGLSKEQAAQIHDGVLEYSASSLKAQGEVATNALTKSIVDTKNALEQAWGGEQSQEFARNLEMAKRAANKLDPGLMDALRETGVIVKNGNVDTVVNATIFKALAKAGASMFAEDTLHGQAASSQNPFAKETEDLAAQGRILTENPERAKILIRASGRTEMWAHVLNAGR